MFVGFSDGNVTAVNEADGAPLWKQRIMLPQGRTELDRMVDVDTTPLIGTTGLLYAASFQGRLKALRPGDGRHGVGDRSIHLSGLGGGATARFISWPRTTS